MPELPDLTAYLEALEVRVVGQRLEKLSFPSPFVLRSVVPPAGDLEGRTVTGFRRLGKRIVFALAGEFFIVVHLMVAGRFQFLPAGGANAKAARGRPRPGTMAEFVFSSGTLVLTEAGKKRRAAVFLVRGEADLAGHDPGGIEPLTSDFAAFRRALATENHTLKRALTDPHLVAGIGNAYSDEILHRARLSPFARTGDLSDEGWRRLYAATRETLGEWVDRLRGELAGRFPDRVTAFRPEMAVHGRFRQPCPVCATAVQRIVYAENEANYCPVCQTGGKLLADRVLSRLLHADWPKSLEELEQKKSAARAAGRATRSGLLVLTLALVGANGALPAAAAGGPEAPASWPDQEPPLGRSVEPPRPLPAQPPNPVRLAEARALLAARTRTDAAAVVSERPLGSYLLLTDIADPALLARTEVVVGALEELYALRYGQRPLGTPREAIVLFATEEDYRRFQAGDPRLAGVSSSTGLAGKGIVATYRGARADEELLGTLVHELGHLLNRRAIGPSLPSWLDEGIADDLGASRIDHQGRLLPASWSRTLDIRGPEIRISGGEAALRDLAALFGPDGSAPGRLDLGGILALDWEEFVGEAGAELHYAAATAFIRMLLAAPAKAALFRRWLAGVADGASPDAEALRRELGHSWEELDRDLALWTRAELARLPPLRSERSGAEPHPAGAARLPGE